MPTFRNRRLLISEILEKGLDPTLPYSQVDKKGKLTGVPVTKQKKDIEEKSVVEDTLSQEDKQEATNLDCKITTEVDQIVEYKNIEVVEKNEKTDISLSVDGDVKKVKKNSKKKKDQI